MAADRRTSHARPAIITAVSPLRGVRCGGGDGPGGGGNGNDNKHHRDDKPKRKPKRDPDPDDDDDGNGAGGASGSDDDAGGNPKGKGIDALLALLKGAANKTRLKEKDKLEITKMPSVIEFRAWKIAVRGEIAAASGRDDAGLQWAMEVENPSATFESLADSCKFRTLDEKLASALNLAGSGVVGRELATETEKAAQQGRLLRGRQALRIVYKWYATNTEA